MPAGELVGRFTPEIVCGCDLDNIMRLIDPAGDQWMHKRGCAFWTPENTWEERIVTDLESLLAVIADSSNLTDGQFDELCATVRNRLDVGTGDTDCGAHNEPQKAQNVPLAPFVGARGFAEVLGVPDINVRVWKQRGKLPDPDVVIDGSFSAWHRGTVLAFAADLRALAGV